MNYIEPTSSNELELDTSLKTVNFVQHPPRLKRPMVKNLVLSLVLHLSMSFVLVYTAFLFSYFLRFNWLNFDSALPRQEELSHYLNLGGIYSFITITLLTISGVFSFSYKPNFLRAAFSIAGVVLTSIALITLMQLLGQPTVFFSRIVFAFLAPVTWLILVAEFAIATFIYKLIREYNTKHQNMVVYAASLDGKSLLTLEDNSRSAFVVKRLLDVVGSLIILLLAIIPFAFIALAIKLDSKGPVIFKQTRVGKNGKHFNFYKFRSMYSDADARFEQLKQFNETQGATFKMQNDPRVTRVGRMLRRTSLDELPQLVNVLMGHMSLVGPRPGLPREVVLYEDWQHRRLEAMPGLTGLWQVSGRSSIGFEEMTKLDIYYMYRCSPWMDLKILVKTVATVFTGKGAY